MGLALRWRGLFDGYWRPCGLKTKRLKLPGWSTHSEIGSRANISSLPQVDRQFPGQAQLRVLETGLWEAPRICHAG